MQYWSQNEVTNNFESWFQDIRTILAGQDTRENYHVMHVASRVVQNYKTDFAKSIAASKWQLNAQRLMKVPDSPDIQAAGTGHTECRQVATHRLPSPWATQCPACPPTRECMARCTRNQSRHLQQAQEIYPGCKGKATPKAQPNMHHDRDEAGMQHNATSTTASCKFDSPPPPPSHAQQQGRVQACFAHATLGENATEQELAPRNKVSTRSLTVLQNLPAEDSITTDIKHALATTID